MTIGNIFLICMAIINLVFLAFSDNLFDASQLLMLFNSYNGFCYHTVEITHQSSVISIHKHTKTDIAIGRSLMYIMNNNGPSTEPCGTPLLYIW